MTGARDGGRQGVSMNAVEFSPDRLRRRRLGRKRQEERWVAQSGPVTVSRAADSTRPAGECGTYDASVHDA